MPGYGLRIDTEQIGRQVTSRDRSDHPISKPLGQLIRPLRIRLRRNADGLRCV